MNLREEKCLWTPRDAPPACPVPPTSLLPPPSVGTGFAPKPGLLASPVEDVVDLPTDISPETQKLAVDAMQDGLEEVPLSRVLAVKQVQELGAGRRKSGERGSHRGRWGGGGHRILARGSPEVL